MTMSSSLSTSFSSSSSSSSSIAKRSVPPSSRTHVSDIAQRLRNHSRQQYSALTSQNILLFLVAFRLLNALSIRTFFQPDEFFQSLEPAWQIAFGNNQGAWLTWEWRHQLRSSLHPFLFAGVYSVADVVARVLRLSPAIRADLLVAAPKAAQAVVAAFGDFYTWKLARRVYGSQSNEVWATLALTVFSPWQWFCATRTLSNCLETTLTIVALYFWPWQWSLKSNNGRGEQDAQGPRDEDTDARSQIARLRQCLLLAALACILRPTNIIIWITLASFTLFGSSWETRKVLVREAVICGTTILALSTVADRLFYGTWTFPPLKFLYFNIAQSLAIFYGQNDWHYYVSQGYPLLLTTALLFTSVGLYRALAPTASPATDHGQAHVRAQLAFVCLFMTSVLSLISHKEVRFIYPLLPSLHVLTAPPLVDFFLPAISRSSRASMPRRLILLFLLLANAAIALYTTLYHASGPASVLSYLREQHQIHAPAAVDPAHPATPPAGITAGFLMPCHSTPWRSHLVYPTIDAWALSCEPPVGMNDTQKAAYLDEADQFYADPAAFLRRNMAGGLRHVPQKPSYLRSGLARRNEPAASTDHPPRLPHEWPDYLVFFAQLEPTLKILLRPSSSYAECWRSWNSAWHDDWRRRGDIVVWCLDPAEQQAWRSVTRKRDQENRDRQFARIVDGFRKEAAALQRWSGGSGSGSRRRQSSSLFSSLPRGSSVQWPWTTKKKQTGVLPSWLTSTSTWSWPSFGKKSKAALKRELWS